MTKGPSELRLEANGLEHHVLEWRAPGAPSITVLLLHGYMDAAGTWDRLAPTIAEQGYRVLAPDMRGFGDGARAPRGAYYHFADYVADLADLIEALGSPAEIALVGHSMGGVIATLYAGAFPERVVRLASLEGLGPPDNPFEVGPTRMRVWIEGLRAMRARGEPSPMSREDARRRLAANHPTISREVLEHRLPHLVRDAPRSATGDAAVVWRFDPLHRTTSPTPFFAKLFIEFAKLVTCPVLFVSGGREGYHPADEAKRLAAFPHVDHATLEGAGHMMHWTRPEALAKLLRSFL
jgi:pimeloyl-ACP methyl ester carboxylesterase